MENADLPSIFTVSPLRERWYVENAWGIILGQVVERIYLLRCQLVHGAATCGS